MAKKSATVDALAELQRNAEFGVAVKELVEKFFAPPKKRKRRTKAQMSESATKSTGKKPVTKRKSRKVPAGTQTATAGTTN